VQELAPNAIGTIHILMELFAKAGFIVLRNVRFPLELLLTVSE
jgi:hypothetical protein